MESACEQPLIVITGPTASGKTSLAIELAEEYDGEIICADSRTVYKGMDIGTAKPTKEEQARVRHHLLDVVEPGQLFSAADFQRLANEAISDIRARGKLPLLVGGTGLYIDAVVLKYTFGSRADTQERERLDAMSLEQLHEYCFNNNVKLPENSRNKRYVIRAIEQKDVNNSSNIKPDENTIVVAIATYKEVLKKRIQDRTEQFFTNDVVNEAILVGKKYGWRSEAMTGNIYRLAKDLHDGIITVSEAKERFKVLDWRLAKRQLTWLRRHDYVKWLTLDDARRYLRGYLDSAKTC